MKISRALPLLLLLLLQLPLSAQNEEKADGPVEIDYNSPKTYVVGDVKVIGNRAYSSEQLVALAGLYKGMRYKFPSDDVSNAVKRLWMQHYFEDVSLEIDRLSENKDTAFIVLRVQERPRVSAWLYTGVRKAEKKELSDRLSLRPGRECSDYVIKTSSDIIKKFYADKGFLNCTVGVESQRDTMIRNATRVTFNVDRGEKVKIKEINFEGNDGVKDFALERSMKKTKAKKIYNFFSSKKFNEKEYPNDKNNMISKFNEAGYRDARIVKDSIYYVEPGRLGIDFEFDQGKKYYFRDITWTGNSVHSTDQLNHILGISKGDAYDVVTMQHRLNGGGKQNEADVSKLYRDEGYLFFNVTPVELSIDGDSVDVEMRISEGKQATLNNIVINGNDLTNERVVRRQVFTMPGNLFSQTDFERSLREIASLGQFDAESVMDPSKGWSIVPNQQNSTVDVIYNVTEKPSSQFELSGGWGARTFVASVGLSFNNFSTRRMFEKDAWRPVPLGDAQNLTLKLQTNGTYYSSFIFGFTEPWLFGKKPTSLQLQSYYSRQTDSYLAIGVLSKDKVMQVYGFTAGIGTRLKWPDNYFTLYNGLSWQVYDLKNWIDGYFMFNDGKSHNLSYNVSLSRNSTDQQIYPRSGSAFSAGLQITPPYSVFRKKDAGTLDDFGQPVKVASYKDINYDNWSAQQRYKWIEYHKWKFSGETYLKLFKDLVLMARAQFGYLGYYNRNWGYSPFEGFRVGGDGMSGYDTYGSDIISLRGYEDYSLTPWEATPYNTNGYYAGNVYDKFTVELRYPLVLQPQSTIFALTFLEGGNCWADIKDLNPLQIKRSAGVGVRIFLPMIGLLGLDWGYGFDTPVKKERSQIHFIIGQQF